MRPIFTSSRHLNRWSLAAGLVGTVALALSTTAALGGFTASITNTGDAASTGSLVMQEQVGSPGTTCLSTGAGTTVNATNANTNCGANKFGALTNAKPGDSNSTNVVITNVGTITANSLTMNAAACAGAATTGATYQGTDTSAGYCGKMDITVEDDTAGTTAATARCVYPIITGNSLCPALSNTYNLSTFATAYGTAATILPTGGSVASNGARTYKVTVGVDGSATNADQGMTATQNITFTFAQ